jgi:uncharacterized membrane protein
MTPKPSRGELVSLSVMSVFYVFAGIMHFVRPAFYLAMMPPFLPAHLFLVYLSGVAEVVLGLALWPPALRRWAAYGIVALLIAVFPANVYMWLADVPVDGQRVPWWGHAIRLPLQGVLIAWAVWQARRAAPRVLA